MSSDEFWSSQWINLTLDVGNNWKQDVCMHDVSLLRELISDASESLQKLVIWQDEGCDFMSSCRKKFSKLKVVQVQYEEALEESLLKKFSTEFAPNLDEVTGAMLHVAINDQGNQFMLKRAKNLIVYDDATNPYVFIEDYRCISELLRLDLRVCHCNSFDDEKILFSILLKSLNTLKELRLYTLKFYNLFKTSDQLMFPNLRRLSLATYWNMPMGNEITILKQLNLPKLCPNLEQLELLLDEGNHDDHVYNEEDCTPAALPHGTDQSDVFLQIKFEYREDHYSHQYFEFLNEIYPKINKVCMLNWELGDSIFEMSSIFSDVRSLEYLEISVCFCHPDVLDFQMDALLCGISVEEVEFLYNSSPRTNAEYNPCIVTSRPLLFNAKNLKELKIIGEANGPDSFVKHNWVIQITENLPVRHVRNIKVTFDGTEELYNLLNRLRAFTTLLCAQV